MSSLSDKLHVITAVFNPIRWGAPARHLLDWVEHMLDSGVNLTVVECQYGERPHTEMLSPHINHIQVRSHSPAWIKENLINIGIQRTPDANYICWSDADIFFEKSNWASETVHALQLYRFIQPWHQAIDRGPNGEILNGGKAFSSFCYQYEQGAPLIPDKHGWKSYAHGYPHPGFCWASTRRVLEYTGGVFELGGMGAADHSMALALTGKAANACPKGINPRYTEHLLRWQDRVQHAVNGRIGYAHNVINHRFHGKKINRQYLSRWEMFLRHGFNPDHDLKRNTHGVLEWAGNKPELVREWMLYLRSRAEDDNASS
jgi:hypothetical protein